MAPAILKSKAALVLITAALASGGTIAGIMMSHHQAAAGQAVDVPLPGSPPAASPAYSSTDNTQALMGPSPVAYSPAAPTAGGVPLASPAPQVAPQMGLSADQLNQLLGPIALYPDPLIAEILPASTYPDQLAACALWLRGNPPPAGIDAQPWEPSIKGLAHSPSVLAWMYNNPDWTRTLGTAFTYQPQDVMNSIQALRAMALADGSLVDTPQQVVVMENAKICIEPAAADVVYVPVYDWRTCYARRVEPTFFVGAHIGPWFDGDCDWDDSHVTLGASWDLGWEHRWDHDRDARPVIVRDGRNEPTKDVIRNTTIVNDNHTVKVGGTPWERNASRPVPSLPHNVNPAGRDLRADQTPTAAPPSRDRGAGQPTVTPAPPDRGPPADRGNPGRGGDRGNPGNGRGNQGRDNRGNM